MKNITRANTRYNRRVDKQKISIKDALKKAQMGEVYDRKSIEDHYSSSA